MMATLDLTFLIINFLKADGINIQCHVTINGNRNSGERGAA